MTAKEKREVFKDDIKEHLPTTHEAIDVATFAGVTAGLYYDLFDPLAMIQSLIPNIDVTGLKEAFKYLSGPGVVYTQAELTARGLEWASDLELRILQKATPSFLKAKEDNKKHMQKGREYYQGLYDRGEISEPKYNMYMKQFDDAEAEWEKPEAQSQYEEQWRRIKKLLACMGIAGLLIKFVENTTPMEVVPG